VEGFADLCLATRPPDPLRDGKDRKVQSIIYKAVKDFLEFAGNYGLRGSKVLNKGILSPG
ncbi:MAG: hypothetical protein WAT21_12210, partial [Saprospiraceae bacterium]